MQVISKALKKFDEVMVRSVKTALKKEQDKQLGSAVATEAADAKVKGKKRKRQGEAEAEAQGDIGMREVVQEIEAEVEHGAKAAKTGKGAKKKLTKKQMYRDLFAGAAANVAEMNELVVHIIDRANDLQHTSKTKNTKVCLEGRGHGTRHKRSGMRGGCRLHLSTTLCPVGQGAH